MHPPTHALPFSIRPWAVKLTRQCAHGVQKITEQGVEKLITECINLENVSLSGCDNITDATLVSLSSLTRLQQLVRLHLLFLLSVSLLGAQSNAALPLGPGSLLVPTADQRRAVVGVPQSLCPVRMAQAPACASHCPCAHSSVASTAQQS
jgi:hypothetical protein